MDFIWGDEAAFRSFAFTFSAPSSMDFSLDKSTSDKHLHHRAFKRRRPLWDVDGGYGTSKKKRRLRLNLITSRLSRPFSSPATNIVDRGSSRIAIWAKGKKPDRRLLRKAAITNCLRLRLGATKHSQGEGELYRETPGFRHVLAPPIPGQYLPRPPSPLGLSNYDALDLEDDIFSNEARDKNQPAWFYSDFNVMDPARIASSDDGDYLDELDDIAHKLPESTPPPSNERLLETMKEKERQKEFSFVMFVA